MTIRNPNTHSGWNYTKNRAVQTARKMLLALSAPGYVDFNAVQLEHLRAALQSAEGQTSGFSDELVAQIAHAVRDISQYQDILRYTGQGLQTRLLFWQVTPIPKNIKLSHIARAGVAAYEADLWSKLFQQFYRPQAIDNAA